MLVSNNNQNLLKIQKFFFLTQNQNLKLKKKMLKLELKNQKIIKKSLMLNGKSFMKNSMHAQTAVPIWSSQNSQLVILLLNILPTKVCSVLVELENKIWKDSKKLLEVNVKPLLTVYKNLLQELAVYLMKFKLVLKDTICLKSALELNLPQLFLEVVLHNSSKKLKDLLTTQLWLLEEP